MTALHYRQSSSSGNEQVFLRKRLTELYRSNKTKQIVQFITVTWFFSERNIYTRGAAAASAGEWILRRDLKKRKERPEHNRKLPNPLKKSQHYFTVTQSLTDKFVFLWLSKISAAHADRFYRSKINISDSIKPISLFYWEPENQHLSITVEQIINMYTVKPASNMIVRCFCIWNTEAGPWMNSSAIKYEVTALFYM